MSCLCKKARVEGRVQGVSFRFWTQQQAEQLGISGSAINCPDGTVLVTAYGQQPALDQLLQRLTQGPSGARVDKVDIEDDDCPTPVPAGFYIG